MLVRAAACVATCVLVLGCAHAPETVMHFSAAQDARWEVRDADGAHLCWLPCNVELDEQEFVTVVRSDGRTRFVVRQEELGRGDFSASVRAQRKHTTGTLVARVLGAALSGAGSALAESDDREHVAVYEFTDTSGNLSSCPAAGIAGFSGTWAEGVAVLPHINEGYMKIAVDTRSDMIFMAESFCGHGFAKDDASLQCYRGPNTPSYFDLTCIHPNADGANVIANLFMDVVNE